MNIRIVALLFLASHLLADARFDSLQEYDTSANKFREAVASSNLLDAKRLSLEMLKKTKEAYEDGTLKEKQYHWFMFPIQYRLHLITLAQKEKIESSEHFTEAENHFIEYYNINHEAYSDEERKGMMSYWFYRSQRPHDYQSWMYHSEKEYEEEETESKTYRVDPKSGHWIELKTNKSGDDNSE
ncbi:MAG: hypothetical protein AAGH40_02975 [Verrucomicrobiota bacterium]